MTVDGASMTAPTKLVIKKSATCSLVILEDRTDALVIGCRKEFK